MRVQHYSHSYPTQSKEFWEGGCDCWQVPPSVPWARGAERTVEEGCPQVTADLEASVKTNVLSSAVEAGCFWRLLCTLSPLLPFPHFTLPHLQPESTFSGPLRQSAAGLEERTGIHGKKTLALSLQQRVALSFYCCISVDWARWGVRSSLAGYHPKALFTSGIWNGIVTMDIREPCPFLLVLPMFERGIRLLVAFSVHCCIHTDTHVCMYVCYKKKKQNWLDLERLFVNTGQMQFKELLLRFGMKDMVLYL